MFLLMQNLLMPSESEETNYKDGGDLYNNLFDAHPHFHIDGNSSVASGITELHYRFSYIRCTYGFDVRLPEDGAECEIAERMSNLNYLFFQ